MNRSSAQYETRTTPDPKNQNETRDRNGPKNQNESQKTPDPKDQNDSKMNPSRSRRHGQRFRPTWDAPTCQIPDGPSNLMPLERRRQTKIHPWGHPSTNSLPLPHAPPDDWRLGVHWTYPSATNLRRGDWPSAQPTGPAPLP